MRRRCDPVVINDPARSASLHICGERQVIRYSGVLAINDAPAEWREHAIQPWRVMFPDLDWKPVRPS